MPTSTPVPWTAAERTSSTRPFRPSRNPVIEPDPSPGRFTSTDVVNSGCVAVCVRQWSVRLGPRTLHTSAPLEILQSWSRLPQYSGPAQRTSGHSCHWLTNPDSWPARSWALSDSDPTAASMSSFRLSRRSIISSRHRTGDSGVTERTRRRPPTRTVVRSKALQSTRGAE